MNTLLNHEAVPGKNTLSAGLDYYKPTMSQLHYEKHPDVEVTFTFKNRGEEILTEHVDPLHLQARLDMLQDRSWRQDELDYFSSLRRQNDQPVFAPDFIDYLATNQLPDVNVGVDEETGDLAIATTGDAPLVTFWETIVMSEVNEIYFENYLAAHDMDIEEVYAEGDRRLSEKIAILQEHPGIKFSDFGTRRHFSYRWQYHVLQRLQQECPENFMGTSNVALSNAMGKTPIGTFAHEMPMIYAGIADALGEPIRDSHNKFLEDWRELYGDNLSTALTDTFGTEFFFADFTPQQAKDWKAMRHDSGDPFEFGERVIEFYESMGIDPREKTIVFSDGLDIDTIVALHKRFEGRIGNVYGWGTTLMNDLGLKPLNIVMKATHVRIPNPEAGKQHAWKKDLTGDCAVGAYLVKLSDNPGKHTGPEDLILQYMQDFAARRAQEDKDVLPC